MTSESLMSVNARITRDNRTGMKMGVSEMKMVLIIAGIGHLICGITFLL